MEQNEEELKKANEFWTKFKKRGSDLGKPMNDDYWENQKKEMQEEIKLRMRMDYEASKRSEEMLRMFRGSTSEPLKEKEKTSTNWGAYLLMGILGIIALFFTIYGLIFLGFVAIVITIQEFLFKKRY